MEGHRERNSEITNVVIPQTEKRENERYLPTDREERETEKERKKLTNSLLDPTLLLEDLGFAEESLLIVWLNL